MSVRMTLQKDILVTPIFISDKKLTTSRIAYYQRNSWDVIGVQIDPASIQFLIYPFTNPDFKSDGLEDEVRAVAVGTRFLYNIKTKTVLVSGDFSEFLSLKYTESLKYPLFKLDDEITTYYINAPLPQELLTLNLINDSGRMNSEKPTTQPGRTLSAILSAFELGLDYNFTSIYGMWNSPQYEVGKYWTTQPDLVPLRKHISEFKLDDLKPVETEHEIYLTDILSLPKGIMTVLSDLVEDVEVYIDINQDIFKRIILTAGGIIVQLHPNCTHTIEDIISMLGTDLVTLVEETEEQ